MQWDTEVERAFLSLVHVSERQVTAIVALLLSLNFSRTGGFVYGVEHIFYKGANELSQVELNFVVFELGLSSY